ncbi:valyl-tRNA synthetase [Gluconacetobacter diazotrophicus PA1 5]|uniref:Valine--tRNA ligase n=1 Tax=Gluconacetobacter diazotrophicus (strain ATCC 49037 / DSM 5601 / CCUG 37298 / CIP 103539 / LMG 7603 / PAl5) TaxID=272568 RepID=A9HI12_GLUDA|nr:valine--tRNA ligase [Gluconacetobacter diazotrophicus]ACI53266.1 valyl-tRNA synthetase [Gluconacetobacter diazotrophicus PA1 5]TWB10357.1 valyl-tRNA synthetase [Gluconacetobacter diazotrophicus]CAP55706.1 Valyl-tRNA synthetase [Gluconacetobacter diazotrophicus PA1 5]
MLNKSFSPGEIESALYAEWERSGAFSADPHSSAQPYTIMIPPPNVTGTLHVGHALTMTLQDTLIRWRRMQGRDTLWQPGTDHAGIATQMVVERTLQKEGISRRDLGREAFEQRVWQWKAESGGGITTQLRRLGASLDWPRERFTMDDGLSQAVREVFVTLYQQGLIYRDRRLVNWDPAFRSAISDLEVDNREVQGSLWYIRYPVEGDAAGRTITVATTRPETLLGDMAVAVHPEDSRYADLVGRSVVLPLTGRRIPIVADLHSDPEKGSGAVKITPAHDFNDFEVGRCHKLAMPSVLDEDARITLAEIADELRSEDGLADPAFVRGLEGMGRDAARKAVVAELERLGWLEKIEPHRNQVPHAERSGAVVEPRLTTQWYCDAATLAGPAIEAVETGQVRFVPQQWENTFFAWMREIQPWCISRQLWWGHRIPAWYGPDGHVFVARDEDGARAEALAHYGREEALTRDEDVLDTWFSSALWPFSTLGWPEQTAELARYYPTDVLVTGFDIIFFWVARMMMMGLHFMKDVPFRTVFIHGLVRDERGQKMSKSKGNGIDPLDMVEQYGADAMRFTVCALTGLGRDVKLGQKRIEEHRSFVTKIWNAARFCEMNGVAPVADFRPDAVSSPLGRWVLGEAARAVAEADAALEAFRFDEYAATCYRFVWNCFCDWFLEFAKPVFTGGDAEQAAEIRAVAAHVLGIILRILQPVMPFVTDDLWAQFGYGEKGSLMTTAWPTPARPMDGGAAAAEMEWVIRFISAIRTVRAEMNVPPSRLAPVLLRDAAEATVARATRWEEAIGRMARVSAVEVLAGDMPEGAAQLVVDEATLVIPLAGIIDLAQERQRLEKERAKMDEEIAKVERKLGNADFIARAKPEIVEENRERLAQQQDERARLDAALARLA